MFNTTPAIPWDQMPAPRAKVIFVPFMDGHIPCFTRDDEPMVVLKPIAEGIGLNWATQYTKIRADQTACVAFSTIQLPGDVQARRTLGVSLETFTLWLGSIHPTKVSDEARELVMDYKREAGRRLREHFFGPAPMGNEVARREEPPAHPIPQTFADALRLAADQQDEIERLKLRNEQLTVKAESFDAWIDGDAVYLVGTVAKMLKIGPKALWDFLYAERILINAPKTKRHREPYAGKPSEKWFKVEPVDPKNANGQKVQTTYVLPYGAEQLRLLLIKRGVLPSEQLALLPGL